MHVRQIRLTTAIIAILLTAACAKKIELKPLPSAGSAKANVHIELTYNRNNTIEVKLSSINDPSTVRSEFTRYVLWVASPDRQHITNAGQLRVDENRRAEITTLTPLRRFTLFITAESAGDVMSPGPDIVFESAEINW
jgi:hypothetical protein